MLSKTALSMVGAMVVIAWVGGCKSGIEDDPILRLSSAEALETGVELMAQEKYSKARDYLTHAFEVEPNSEGGQKALLMVADSHFQQGGETHWIRSESRYRDYLTRFPTSARADYVQYQIARSLSARVERPDRDQTATEQAVEEFRTLERLFPSSEYALLAGEEIVQLRSLLADHHFAVGDFYLRYRNPLGAQWRLERMLEEFPDYPSRDKVLFHLGRSFMRQNKFNDARDTFETLRQEFPESEWISEIPTEIPEQVKLKDLIAEEAKDGADEPSEAVTEEGTGDEAGDATEEASDTVADETSLE